MITWSPVEGSTRVIAEAFVEETETILVRFRDGVEWYYAACPTAIWREFTANGQSRGAYIARVLDAKPNGRWNG